MTAMCLVPAADIFVVGVARRSWVLGLQRRLDHPYLPQRSRCPMLSAHQVLAG